MSKKSKIGVIILAAGASRRLGHPKQLVQFKGKTLLQHIVDVSNSVEFCSRVLVLGARANEIQGKSDLKNFEVVYNESWEEGMSTSIREGLFASLKSENRLEHILILLADQPFVTKENINQLIILQLEKNVQATFSEYAGDIGVPAIFSREIFPQLRALKGDQGAKKLIYDGNLEFATLKFEKGNFDVDTSNDIELLRQMEQK